MRLVLAALLWLAAAGAAWACGPDPAPAPAAAFGLTCETFVDNMTDPATFDLSNTKAPGFHWYINNNFPTAAETDCPTEKAAPYCWPPQVAQTGDFTINGSGLTMNSSVSGNNYPWFMFTTCVYDGTRVNGTTFDAPFYIDVSYSFSGTIVPPLAYSAWSSVWLQPIQWWQAGQVGGGIHTVEIDLEESPYGRQLHDYYDSNASPIANEQSYSVSLGGSPNGTLVITPAFNGGIGLLERATNDVVYDTLQYSPTMVPIGQSGSTGLPVGTFSLIPQEHYCLQTTTGTGQTTNITRIAVWQHPPGNGGSIPR